MKPTSTKHLPPIQFKAQNPSQLIQNKNKNDPQENILHGITRQELEKMNLTNQILVENKGKNSRNIYIPGYLRLKIKNFTQIDLVNLDAQINASLIFNVYYGFLLKYLQDESLFSQQKPQKKKQIDKQSSNQPKQNQKQQKQKQNYKKQYNINQLNVLKALRNQIILNFPRDEALILAQSKQKTNLQTKVKLEEAKNEVKYTVRKLFHLHLQGHLFWSPLQEIYSIIQITVQPIQLKIVKKDNKQQVWNIKINLMDNASTTTKLSYGDQLSFGNYSLIKNKLRAFYSNDRVTSHKQFYIDPQERSKSTNKKKGKQNKSIVSNIFGFALTLKKSNQITKKNIISNEDEKGKQKSEKLTKSQPMQKQQLTPSQNYIKNLHSLIYPLYQKQKQQTNSNQLSHYEKNHQSNSKLLNDCEPQDTHNKNDKNLTNNSPKKKKGEDKKDKASKQSKVEYFQHAHFIIPLYKEPLAALITIFLPLWLLALINLGIFFQDNSLGDRIGSISALMIAFVAFIPTIRQQIPPNPSMIFVQILIYLQTSTCLLALLHSMNIRNQTDLNFVWYESGQFLISVIITILCFLPICYQLVYHYTCRLNKFEKQPPNEQQILKNKQKDQKKPKQKNEADFKRDQWKNKVCDNYYLKKFYPSFQRKYAYIDAQKQKMDLLVMLKSRLETMQIKNQVQQNNKVYHNQNKDKNLAKNQWNDHDKMQIDLKDKVKEENRIKTEQFMTTKQIRLGSIQQTQTFELLEEQSSIMNKQHETTMERLTKQL